jgi:hypothetical protein
LKKRILAVLVITKAISATTTRWPGPESERWVLLGIFVLSLIPVLLVIHDALMRHGAVIEY